MKDEKDYIDINKNEETEEIAEKKPGRFKRAYLAFTGKAVEEVEKDDKEEKKGMKKGTKIAIITASILTATGLGMFIGKATKNQNDDVDDVNNDDEDDQEYSEEELTED